MLALLKRFLSSLWHKVKKIWPKQPRARATAIITIILVVFGLIYALKALEDYMVKRYLATHNLFPPPPVTVIKATTETWQQYISSVGTMNATQGISLAPQVDGVVTKIMFHSGDIVRQGQPVLMLDTNVLNTQLNQAQASARLAKLDYERQIKLYQSRSTSRQALDQASATWQQDAATVDQYKQLIAQKIIRAPFSGVLGIRMVSLGQYLSPGTEITNLQKLTPIFVNYTVPEQDLSKIHVGQLIELTTNAYPNITFKGKISAIDAKVDSNTKGIQVQATLANQKLLLKPGMFTIVHTMLPEQQHVVTVPQSTITYSIYGDSIYTIKKQTDKAGKTVEMAHQNYITTGDQRFNRVAVLKGLKAGDSVVTTGQLRLSNNIPVTITKAKQADTES